MDNGNRRRSVLNLVNLARSAYSAPELEALLGGRPHSASICAIGRSLRNGVEDWLFVAVGNKYLRLWALGKDSAAIADLIMTAWQMPHQLLIQPGGQSGCVIFPLPAEIREFVDLFDHGLLPNYQDEVGQIEMRRLSELARAMPPPVGRLNSRGNLRGIAQPVAAK